MIEVLVTGSIACAICGAWWASNKKMKAFFNRMTAMNGILDDFIKINDIEYIDFELFDNAQIDEVFSTYINSDIVECIGKCTDEKGYDLYRMRMEKGYSSLNHRHKFSDEFFYVLSGNICVNCDDGKKICIKEGEHLFVRNKVFHHIVSIEDSDVIVIAKPSLIRRK